MIAHDWVKVDQLQTITKSQNHIPPRPKKQCSSQIKEMLKILAFQTIGKHLIAVKLRFRWNVVSSPAFLFDLGLCKFLNSLWFFTVLNTKDTMFVNLDIWSDGNKLLKLDYKSSSYLYCLSWTKGLIDLSRFSKNSHICTFFKKHTFLSSNSLSLRMYQYNVNLNTN